MARAGVSDQELVVRIGLSDLDSLGELFVRYQQAILSFAHRMVGDASAADALTQDVFLRVLRHADKFDPTQAVRPWLYTIAANLCRDHLSKQGRRATVELAAEPPDSVEGPLEQLANAEECDRVRKAVAELPEIYREIIVLRVYQQLPYAEISQILDIREGTARSRMEYALNRLRRAMLSPREREILEANKARKESGRNQQKQVAQPAAHPTA